MPPATPRRFPAAVVFTGVLAVAVFSGGAAALADAGRLQQARLIVAPDVLPTPAV